MPSCACAVAALLYEFCRSRGVPHRRSGKWIVATHDHQIGQLESIAQAGAGNGVSDLYPHRLHMR